MAPKNRLHTLSQDRIEFRDDARDRDRRDRGELDVPGGEQLREKDAVLVGRAPQLGRDAPRVRQRRPGKTPELRFGVADVDRQEHCINSSTASSSRAASVGFFRAPELAPVVAPQQHELVFAGAEAALAAHVVDGDRIEMLARSFSRAFAS